MFRQFENFIRTNCQWTIIHVIEWPTMLKKEAISWNRIEQVAFFPWTNRKEGQSPLNIYPRRKNSEQTVWMAFSFGVCLSFTNCLRTSVWKVNETRLYGLFQGKFPGATEHLKRLSCFFFFTGRNVLNGNLCFISKIASLSEFQALGLICVNNWPKPWTVSCPCKWQTN